MLLQHNPACSLIVVYSCFPAAMADLIIAIETLLPTKTNIFTLFIYRKKFPIPALDTRVLRHML